MRETQLSLPIIHLHSWSIPFYVIISCSHCPSLTANTLLISFKFCPNPSCWLQFPPAHHPLPLWTFFFSAWNLHLQTRLPTPRAHMDARLTLFDTYVSSFFHTDTLLTLLDSIHATPGSCYAWTLSHLTPALPMSDGLSCLNPLFSVSWLWCPVVKLTLGW